MQPFPHYGDCEAKESLDDLFRLVAPNLFSSDYMDSKAAAALVAVGLQTFKNLRTDAIWQTDPILARLDATGGRLNVVCAALFDLVCNAEYLRGRVTNRAWIYCNRCRDQTPSAPVAYYSFLKQCPRCSQDIGLGPRISGAQHKPSSHHIGEITTVAMALILALLGNSAAKPMDVSTITKQSHNVDAIAWREDLLVLFEIKASPLVTFPIRTRLDSIFTEESQEGYSELSQHCLVDVDFAGRDLSLYLANLDLDVPLGAPREYARWPYEPIFSWLQTEKGLLNFMRAWGEVFLAYSVPKTQRQGRDISLGYLANGWGDEIDSNKTKGGLGRTDDIKKGTYQLLKYAAYYREGSPNLPIRGALTANLDPLFLYDDYLAKLIDGRWAPAQKFRPSAQSEELLEIWERELFFLYDAVLTLNKPVVNDKLLQGCFDVPPFEAALVSGRLDRTLNEWASFL